MLDAVNNGLVWSGLGWLLQLLEGRYVCVGRPVHARAISHEHHLCRGGDGGRLQSRFHAASDERAHRRCGIARLH